MARCILDIEGTHGWLMFEAPDRRIDTIPVTTGPSYERFPDRPKYEKGPVWHVDYDDKTVTVTPSIDIKGRYHTGNPVTFERHPGPTLDKAPPST